MDADKQDLRQRTKTFALRIICLADLRTEANELLAIFGASVKTTKQNKGGGKNDE